MAELTSGKRDVKALYLRYIFVDSHLNLLAASPEFGALTDNPKLSDLFVGAPSFSDLVRNSGAKFVFEARAPGQDFCAHVTPIGDGVLLIGAATGDESEELRRALERETAANRLKSAFLAAMSHELREPLLAVIGVVDALRMGGLSSEQGELVGLIEQSGEALTRAVDDMLDFARMEAGALTLAEEPFDLRGELFEAARRFESVAGQAGLAYSIEISPRVSGVFLGDVARLKQVTTSLISNAVRYTQKGRVTVAIDLEFDASLPRLIVEVTDTGPELAARGPPELFAGGLPDAGGPGATYGVAGLGLAISRGLIERMGGGMSIQVRPRQGAAFRVWAPIKPAKVKAPRQGTDPSPPTALQDSPADQQIRCLVAEDHPANRRIIELMLAPLGVRVSLVSNGQEAVDAFRNGQFGMVLLDMQMPVLDGVEAAKAMRDIERIEQRPRTPIAMLTANVLPKHRSEAMGAGADLFIAKPVTPATLAASLDALIRATDAYEGR